YYKQPIRAHKSSSFRIVFLIHTAPNVQQSGTHLPAFFFLLALIVQIFTKRLKNSTLSFPFIFLKIAIAKTRMRLNFKMIRNCVRSNHDY
ncbi:hypothetical protein FWK35_00025429, partial [Aphis craccivora]